MTPGASGGGGGGEYSGDDGLVDGAVLPGATPWLSASLRANASSAVCGRSAGGGPGGGPGGGGDGANDGGGANEGGGAKALLNAGGANWSVHCQYIFRYTRNEVLTAHGWPRLCVTTSLASISSVLLTVCIEPIFPLSDLGSALFAMPVLFVVRRTCRVVVVVPALWNNILLLILLATLLSTALRFRSSSSIETIHIVVVAGSPVGI